MKAIISLAMLFALVAVVAMLTAADANGTEEADGIAPSYHDEWPAARATGDTGGHSMPLPAPQDHATADAMATAGLVMIEASTGMDATAHGLLASEEQQVLELGEHWRPDAHALAGRGDWMIATSTSDAMIHHPENASRFNLANLSANGAVMVADGAAMARHGREMTAQVNQLRTDGYFDAETHGRLVGQAEQLIAAGAALERDGNRMQAVADRLQRSLGT